MFVWTWWRVVGRLDQILGKQGGSSSSKGKDVYDNKYCLASRIVNVERQVALMIQTLFISCVVVCGQGGEL
jgi:hypothetical protein